MQIKRTDEFIFWFDQQTEKAKAQIDARLKNIEMFDYFGDHKALGEKLLELRACLKSIALCGFGWACRWRSQDIVLNRGVSHAIRRRILYNGMDSSAVVQPKPQRAILFKHALRWKNGRRVYYSLIVRDALTLVLVGGFKNAQEKDIKKARKILERESAG